MVRKIIIVILSINFVTVLRVLGKHVPAKNRCDGSVELHGKHHKQHVLAKGIDRPYQLAYYNHTHKLFYSYNLEEKAEDTFALAYLDTWNSSKIMEVGGVRNGFATAVDEDGRAVYFGGSEGVYKYHPEGNDTGVKEIVPHVNVWDMFYGNRTLYYITYPRQKLYKLNVHDDKAEPERVASVHEEIYQFALDGAHDMYITNRTGVYRVRNGTDDRIHYRGETMFRAVAVDRKGEVHFAGRHGIFVARDDKQNHTLHEIAHVRNLFGLAFDEKNDIIYADYHEIVKILPNICGK
ncbi:Ommochrome-binding protein [Eumeta japonica]|uniref:Ommochrome-binding protein n=1 Tax=Eumeta variegata TaxID=151549 RepID=A0A4C1U9F0_EUMVA|nr:Ommochrome-binding protein [Eumeta japonica]